MLAKLEPLVGETISDSLEVKGCLGKAWKQRLTELSGGQRYGKSHVPILLPSRF